MRQRCQFVKLHSGNGDLKLSKTCPEQTTYGVWRRIWHIPPYKGTIFRPETYILGFVIVILEDSARLLPTLRKRSANLLTISHSQFGIHLSMHPRFHLTVSYIRKAELRTMNRRSQGSQLSKFPMWISAEHSLSLSQDARVVKVLWSTWSVELWKLNSDVR
jgi:hypothetical protein